MINPSTEAKRIGQVQGFLVGFIVAMVISIIGCYVP